MKPSCRILQGMRVLLTIQLLLIAYASSYVLNAPFEHVKRSAAAPNLPAAATTNQCQTPCAATCSPDCLPDCCVKSIQPSPPNAAPAVKSTAPIAAAGAVPSKPEMMITSVEEGETEECGDKGFNSPTDNSEDPPGTITIPLPPTMYVPPRPGEEPKELPLPDFKLPASILQGVPPSKSITLEPETVGTPVPAVGNAPAAVSPPVIAAPISAPISAPAASIVNKLVPPPPSPPSTGIGLMYPKLPPVTVSEIPGRKPVIPISSKLPLVGGPLPPVKMPPVTTSELPGSKLYSPVLPMAVAPSAVLAPSLPVAKLPTHCVADSRDETKQATPPAAAPPVVPPVMNAPAASAPPAAPASPVLSDGSVSSIPGVVEVAPSVVSLSDNQGCVQNTAKPIYDVNVVKELHKEISSKPI